MSVLVSRVSAVAAVSLAWVTVCGNCPGQTAAATSFPRRIQAEECAGVQPNAVVADGQAGGGVVKAVLLTPGGLGVTATLDVEPGIYSVSTIARNRDGKSGIDLMGLDVKEERTGQVRSWTMPVTYVGQYGMVGRMYFPAHAGGRYTVTVSLALKAQRISMDSGTLENANRRPEKFSFEPNAKTLINVQEPLLVDCLEIRDALEGCAKKGFKAKRMLTTDEELAAIRKNYAAGKTKRSTADYDKVRLQLKDAGSRTARADALWAKAPEFNELTGFDDYTRDAHGWLLGGRLGRGALVEVGELYEKTGNPDVGWDGAVLLCALAEKYPGFDALTQLALGYRFSLHGNRFGNVGSLATVYDRLFDVIKGNQELAQFVGSKIAWVKTPDDVVKLLDVYLLQAGVFSLSQTKYAGEVDGVIAALVHGVNAESDRMLSTGALNSFTAILPHKFFVTGPLDDLSYMSPFRNDLWEVAPYLERYHRAGGSPRFDLAVSHPGYSTQKEIERWEQVHISGGFRTAMPALMHETRVAFMPHWPDRGPATVGGHMGMFVTLTNSSPSRVLENVHGTHVAMDLYCLSILESGQFQSDLLKMRGAWVQYNEVGLPLQATAHGGLSLTHFNRQSHQDVGRPALAGKDAPTRARNGVEVDSWWRLPRHNPSGVNYLTGEAKAFPVGMNTCFAPLTGAQFMEHVQTPFGGVSLFVRQTAMIDVGDAESYLFDVVRVRGGKTHAYCLNAFPGAFASNLKMKPVPATAGPAANECLAGYYDATQSAGLNPPVIQGDWMMAPLLQKHYQDQDLAMTSPADQARYLQDKQYRCNQYDSNRVTTTRLSLLGHEKDLALVGHWSTVRPDLDYWNLYVQSRQDQGGLENVYPAIIETFAGNPFLAEKRLAGVSPPQKGAEAAVGLEVRTPDGRTDLLYSSVKPGDVATVAGKVSMSGKFAMVSRDGQGIRQISIVGGSELKGDDFLLKPDRATYAATILAADYDKSCITVDAALPATALKGAYLHIPVDWKIHTVKLEDLKPAGARTTLFYDRQAKIYQANLRAVDEHENVVRTALVPYTVRSGMTLTNEGQNKFWKVKDVPEKEPWLKLDAPVAMSDFTDANGDGKVKVSACLFGPGDRVMTDTHVNVERKEIGLFAVESNVGCAVGLPKGVFGKVELSPDGKDFSKIAAQPDGAMLVVKLSANDLPNGKGWLRLSGR
jgi:hypothetical protein